jgi:hypothetical protein
MAVYFELLAINVMCVPTPPTTYAEIELAWVFVYLWKLGARLFKENDVGRFV